MPDITEKFWQSMAAQGVERPTSSRLAADAISRDDLVSLFEALSTANALIDDPDAKSKGASLAALRAVEALQRFVPARLDQAGEFTRPLRLLTVALKSGRPLPGDVLSPSTRGQLPGAERREIVDQLKGVAAYAASVLKQLGRGDRAFADVARIAIAHGFPPPPSKNSKKKADIGVDALAARFEEWARTYPRKLNASADYFRGLVARGTLADINAINESDAREYISHWLTQQLTAGGYSPIRTRAPISK